MTFGDDTDSIIREFGDW